MDPAVGSFAGESWGVTPEGVMFLFLILFVIARLLYRLIIPRQRRPETRSRRRMSEDELRRWNRRIASVGEESGDPR